MAKAHITTKDGASIIIEGTAEEMMVLMARYDGQGATLASPQNANGRPGTSEIKKNKAKRGKRERGVKPKTGPASLIAEMIDGGMFKKPKILGEIKKDLVQGGHYFTDASIAVALLRAVKTKSLRRLKQGDKWAYVI